MLHPKCICVNCKHIENFEEPSQIDPSSVKQDHSPQVKHTHIDNPQALAQVFQYASIYYTLPYQE